MEDGLCPVPLFWDDQNYTFFFPRLLSKMNRSLGLCFVRVLNPFANCPHGLTG